MPINEYDEIMANLSVGNFPKRPLAPDQGSNEYDEIFQEDKDIQKSRIKRNVILANEQSPDQKAKAIDISNRLKVPLPVVERNLVDFEKQDKQKSRDYDQIIDRTPGLAEWMQNPDNVVLAKDDIDNLGAIEQSVRAIAPGKKPSNPLINAFNTGWSNLENSAAHVSAAYGLMDIDRAAELIAESNKKSRELADGAPTYVKEFNKVMAEEQEDIDKAFERFNSGWNSASDGRIFDAIKDYGAGGALTVGETLDLVITAAARPRGLLYTTTETMANSIPALSLGAAGAATGSKIGAGVGTLALPGIGTVSGATIVGTAGFVSGTFAGSAPVEVGAWINQALQERGVDVTDANAIREAYRDPTFVAEIRAEAERKGLTTAGVDAVFSLFAGRFTAAARTAGKGAGGVAKGIGKDLVVESTGEAASEFTGQVAARKGDLAQVRLGESVFEGVVSLGHSAGDTVIGTSMRTAFSADTVKATKQIAEKTKKAIQGSESARVIGDLATKVKESKVSKLASGKIKEFVETVTGKENEASVFFQTDDWDSYFTDQGKSPAKAAEQLLKDGGKSYHESKEAGGIMEVPLADFIADVGPTTDFEGLQEIVRTDPDGLTASESNEFLENLPATMDELANEANEQGQREFSAQQVKNEIQTQLVEGGLQVNTAEQYSQLYEAAFNSLGERTGIAPDELFKRFGLNINISQQSSPGGQVLFQSGEDRPRGQIRFGDTSFNIDLLRDADLSTFLHETGHFYTEVLSNLALQENATEQIREDFNTLIQWAGFESSEQWSSTSVEGRRNAHEQIARGFEAYLMEGKAPNSNLQAAFDRFRTWLTSIYRTMRGLDVELTNDVRNVFNRLLATEDELSFQGEEISQPAMFLENSGMSEKDEKEYFKAINQAKQSANEELSTKMLDSVKKSRTKEWKERRKKVSAQVREEVNQEKRYVALSVLQKGVYPDGSALPEGLTGLKVSRESLVDSFGAERTKNLPKPFIYAREGGVHHENVAEILGFTSGEEMISSIESAPRKEVLINQLTEARMNKEAGDLLNSDTIAQEAEGAVANTSKSKRLHMELKHLASDSFAKFKGLVKRINRKPPPIAEIRKQAESTIGSRKVRNITPVVYKRAQAKHAREAMDALLKGDIDSAFISKQRELFNHELHRAALRSRSDVDKAIKFINRFSKKEVRSSLGKAGEQYLQQIDGIMERFDFRRGISLRKIDERKELKSWIEEQKAQGFNPAIPDSVANEANRQHYKDLTFNQLKEVEDSIRSINHLAGLKNKLLKASRLREFDRVRDEAIASIELHAKRPPVKELESRLPNKELLSLGSGYLASQRKFSSLMRQMDGLQNNGTMWETFVLPLNKAGDQEAVQNEIAAEKFNEVFKRYSLKEKVNFYKKEFIPEINDSLTKAGRLSVALNWGNQDSRAKLMEGRGWNRSQVESILEGLDKRDWEVVQSIWDFIDSYWEDTRSLSMRVDGVPPKKVEASPVETQFGTFKGGYYPLKYDESASPKAFAHLAEEAAKRSMNGANIRSTTNSGHRKERVEGVRLPVRLDLGVAFEHVGQVIHDLTHYETLIDLNRLLGDSNMQKSIIDNYGSEIYGQMRDMITDVASGDVPAQNAFERSINWLRAGVSISAMGWNVMTSLMQPLGLTQSIVRVGPKWVAKGMSRWIGDAARMENTTKWIHSVSPLMRLRAKTQMREINEIRSSLKLKSALLKPAEDSYFWMITRGQMIADIPTWLGAYEKALAENNVDEKRAVSLADQAVLDSQGGGQIKDLAKIQRGGPLMKLWTNFYSYFNTTYNLTAEAIARTKFNDPSQVGRLAVDMLMLYTVPAILGLALREAVTGGDDSDETFAERVAREQMSYIMGTMVGVRELGSAVQGFYGYSGPAGTRFFAEAGGLIKQLDQGEVDEALLRSMNKTAGILLHYPANQVDRTTRGFIGLTKGKNGPQSLLTGPPRN